MAAKRENVTYFSLRAEVLKGEFRPIYVLQGEEPYYIDQLSDLIVEKALDDSERDFNLNIYYGNEADVREVIATDGALYSTMTSGRPCGSATTVSQRRLMPFCVRLISLPISASGYCLS